MIQFDQSNSHPKYSLITKTTFEIICLFVKSATHTLSDSSYESFECDPKTSDSFKDSEHSYSKKSGKCSTYNKWHK